MKMEEFINTVNNNPLQSKNNNLENIKYYINNVLNTKDKNTFFNIYFPFILNLCNNSKNEILYDKTLRELNINRLECASLIAKSFLNKTDVKYVNLNNPEGYKNKTFIDIFNKPENKFNDINFDDPDSYNDYIVSILKDLNESGDPEEMSILSIEKIKFMMNYFKCVYDMYKEDINYLNNDFVYFKKVKISNKFNIKNKLSKVEFVNNRIENCNNDFAKVIFSNKYIGGKVLTIGCCQEEIKFLTNPELLVGLLIFNNVEDNESFIVDNSICFSDYTGYGFDLKFKEPESEFLKKEYLVSIDAYRYNINNKKLQYEIEYKNRDIIKAISGFSSIRTKTIITGNWGCGAFNGDYKLKFLIQWYSSSICNKSLMYSIPGSVFETNNVELIELINKIEKLLIDNTDDLIKYIYDYGLTSGDPNIISKDLEHKKLTFNLLKDTGL